MSGMSSTNWKTRNSYKILIGKPLAKNPLRNGGRKLKDNTKMHLR